MNFTTPQFLNKLSEHLFGIIKIRQSQFKTNVSFSKNDIFQFDFVKGLVQTQRPTVAMATNLSFHLYIYFLDKLLHIPENFVLSKPFCSQVIHT